MGQIEDLRLFVQIVDSRSISGAAEQLHIAKSAVSRRLALLEQRYAARLIYRKPGHWQITSTGHELYQRAVDVVNDVDEVENDFTEAAQQLAGPLVVSVPREFGQSFLNPALMAFKIRHPEIQLMVDFDDRKIDLLRDNYDFAIRIAVDLEPNLIGNRIGSVGHQMFASPAYLARRGTPNQLSELKQHDLLDYGATRRSSWSFKNAKGKTQTIEFQPSLNSNSGAFLLEAAKKGIGISKLPEFICQTSIEAGQLVPLLTDLSSPEFGIYLVYSEKRRLNRRMRLFAEEMKTACSPADDQTVS
ncbi:MAG: LysR family transcriptional regulator [Rhizobiales bacterium]|nr:LysR family transcriptional regulator [Hyphomicrobiales bacterium]NRB15389.1 LysR family transcriptional regulator [Hyphomicrobiales bacterium]